MEIKEKYTSNIGNVLFLKLGDEFTGIGFIVYFTTYIYITYIFLSTYQVLDNEKGIHTVKEGREKGEGRKEKKRKRIDTCNVVIMDLLSLPGKATQTSIKYKLHPETLLKKSLF